MFGFGYVIFGIFALLGMLVQSRLRSKMEHYGKMPMLRGMTGADVARAMLTHYGIHDVQIVPASGFLTDHYNPLSKTVALSQGIYDGRSITAAAVAAHECGHAVQHATAYSMLTMRSAMVPIVNIAAGAQQFIWMAMMVMASEFMLGIAVIAFGITTAFSLITLPVEFDASRRALNWLDQTGTLQGDEYAGAKDALWWAAMTYVVAALGAAAQFLYLLMRFLGSNRD
jgi:uncharacterized protein